MLKKFFQEGYNDQLAVMGEVCKIKNNIKQTETNEFKAVITTKDGKLEVEIGAVTYLVDSHALIPASFGQEQIVGNRLMTKDAEYIITSAVKSLSDAAYSCDLVKVKSI